ncbi:hypothetical protein WA158_002161 [Blastocystis sp. Blastoise]
MIPFLYIILSILCINFVCATSTNNDTVRFYIRYYCYDPYSDKFSIWGKTQEQLTKLTDLTCQNKQEIYTEIELPATLNSEYTFQYTSSGSRTTYSYFAAYDRYGSLVTKVSIPEGNLFEQTFSILNPIDRGDTFRYTKVTPTGDWYKYDYSTSTWSDITTGSQIENSDNDQYYRKIFNLPNYNTIAAFTISINFVGNAEIYLREQLVWSGQQVNTTDSSFYNRIVLSGYYLQEVNTLAIHIHNEDSTSRATTYINLSLSYFLISADNGCAYTLDETVAVGQPEAKSAYALFDFLMNTEWTPTSQVNDISVSITLQNNTYIQVSGYTIFSPYITEYSARDYALKGRNSDSDEWSYLDYRTNDGALNGNRTHYLSSNNKAFNQFQFHLLKNLGGSSSSMREVYLYTCNSLPTHLTYSSLSITLNPFIPIIPITPVFAGNSAFTISPSLPEGLEFNTYNGVISGTTSVIQTATQYTITAHYPETYSVTLTIAIEYCNTDHLFFVRTYGDLTSSDEAIFITSTTTKQILWKQMPYSYVSRDNDKDYFQICAPKDIYSIGFYKYDKSTVTQWASESTFQIYISPIHYKEVINETQLVNFEQIFYERFNMYGSTNFLLNTNTYFYYESTLKHKVGEIPANWYSSNYDDNTWENYIGSSSAMSKEVHLFRYSFDVDTIDEYGVNELYVKYLSGIQIYINEHLVLSNRIEGSISTTSTVSTSYTTLYNRRITFPQSFLFKSSSSKKNIIAVAILPDMNTTIPSVPFDMFMRDIGKGDTRSIYYPKYDALHFKYLFDHNYKDQLSLFYPKETTFTITSKRDEYFYMNHYAIVVDTKNPDNYPYRWTLQGRQNNNGNENWIDIDRQEFVDWHFNKRVIFPISEEKRGIYNEFRFVDMYSPYSNFVNMYQLEVYSSSLAYDYPSFNFYKPTTTLYVGTYIEEFIPDYNYLYHNWNSEPSLPVGITIDEKTGHITGIPTEYTGTTLFTIWAIGPDNKKVSKDINIKLENCYDKRSLFSVEIRFINTLREFTVSLAHGKEGTGEKEFFSLAISNMYTGYYNKTDPVLMTRLYPLCIPDDYYLLSLYTEKEEVFAFPVGYSLHNAASTVSTSSLMDKGTKRVDIIIDANSPIQKYATVWKYHACDDNSIDWLNKKFDIKSWDETSTGVLKGDWHKYILLRTYFSLTNMNDHSSLDFHFTTQGSVTVYINKVVVYEYTSTDLSLTTHSFTFFLQNALLKTTDNIIGIQLYSNNPFRTTEFYMDSAYTYGQKTRFINSFTYSSPSAMVPDHPLTNLFDFDYYTYTEFTSDGIIDIVFNDEQAPLFNSISLQLWNTNIPTSLSIYGRESDNAEFITLLYDYQIVVDKSNTLWIDVPMGVLRLRYIQLTFKNTPSNSNSIIISDLAFAYSNYQTTMCPSIDSFPSVGENIYSYKPCNPGYQGYQMRECDGLVFEEIDNSHCTYLPPLELHYPDSIYQFFTYSPITDLTPSYRNIIQRFEISPVLPNGLVFDTEKGTISGIPTIPTNGTIIYTITGSNDKSSTSTKLSLQIIQGSCYPVDEYPQTTLFTTTTVSCGMGYVGERKRPCELDYKNNIVWGETEDHCTSIILIIGSSASILLVIAIIIVILISRKIDRKRKEEIRVLRMHTVSTIKESQINVKEPLQI